MGTYDYQFEVVVRQESQADRESSFWITNIKYEANWKQTLYIIFLIKH